MKLRNLNKSQNKYFRPKCIVLALHISIGSIRRPVLFGEGQELKAVEGILSVTNVLVCILSPNSFTGNRENVSYRKEHFGLSPLSIG